MNGPTLKAALRLNPSASVWIYYFDAGFWDYVQPALLEYDFVFGLKHSFFALSETEPDWTPDGSEDIGT